MRLDLSLQHIQYILFLLVACDIIILFSGQLASFCSVGMKVLFSPSGFSFLSHGWQQGFQLDGQDTMGTVSRVEMNDHRNQSIDIDTALGG